jgi:hypothetical protein
LFISIVACRDRVAFADDEGDSQPLVPRVYVSTPPPDLPVIGTMTKAQVRDYLLGLEQQVRDLEREYGDTQTDEDRLEVKRRLDRARKLLRAERERLTKFNKGLVTGGSVLTGLGGATILAGVGVMLAPWLGAAMFGVRSSPTDEEIKGAEIAGGVVMGIGAAHLAAGIPMIVVGVNHSPREAPRASFVPEGLTVVVRF